MTKSWHAGRSQMPARGRRNVLLLTCGSVESVEVITARNKLTTLVQLVCEPDGEPVMIHSGDRRAVLISAEDLSQLRADLTTRTAKLRACEQQLTASGA